MMVRLHKYLAACGIASRRQCEFLMSTGRVTVDGEISREPGTQVDPDHQIIECYGRLVKPDSLIYIALNKPPGHVCTSKDPQGRPRAIDLIPKELGRVYTVGRLDEDSEGLLLLTNDGDFAHRLSHPRHGVKKIYDLWLKQSLSTEEIKKWLVGIESEGQHLKVLNIEIHATNKTGYGYRVTLGEGKNRHLRRMADAMSKTVLRLKRVSIGSVNLGTLKRSSWRNLLPGEVKQLQAMYTSEAFTLNKGTSKSLRTVDRKSNPR